MGESVEVACAIPDAADTAFQIHCLKRSAYAAVLRAFCAQSDLLSGAKEGCLVELRNELKILEIEHGECLVKARSNKQIKSLSAGLHSKRNTCNTEVMSDTPDLACVLPDAGDSIFQLHCLERSAYAFVLRTFCAVTNHLSWVQVKLLTKLRHELRISHIEHKEVLVKVSSNEHIKSLRKFSLANFSVLTKTEPAFDAHPVVHYKIGTTGQVSTSSTSCLTLSQQSPISERSMSSTRDIGISDSSRAKERPCFEPHALMSSKRLKSINSRALSYLECTPSEHVPVNGCTDDTLDSETLSCEAKAGFTSSPIFQEKHCQSNAGHVPSCVGHDRQESGKRKAEVPMMRVLKSLDVMDRKYGIKYLRLNKKDSDLEHGSEIIKLCLTDSLLNKVERLFRENPDPANLEKAKSILKAQEKDLLDALVKLSEVSYDVVYFSANGQRANLNKHDDGKGDEAPSKPVSSSDEAPPETRLGDGGEENNVKIQGVAATALSPSATTTPTGATANSSQVMPAPSKKRFFTKFTAEQERMREFAHRAGWRVVKADAEAFCAQVGVSRHVFMRWVYRNNRLAKIPPPSLSSPPLLSHHHEHPPAATAPPAAA